MQQLLRNKGKIIGWTALAIAGIVLLVAAINKKNNSVCSDIKVEINGSGNNFFVDEKQVISILKMSSPIKGELLQTINLKMLEDRLKKDKWIEGAELFFDSDNVLHVSVEEKNPVARIFTSAGSSFYIDSACRRLPLSERLSARVPMFTSFPSGSARLSRPDSQLMAEVKDLAMFIQADDLWRAHIEQIDITPDGFELVPIIGHHIIVLGRGENYREKFDRLYTFYKQVWTKVGLEKYERIDVQYNNQVVATKRGTSATRIDSVTARAAFESFLAEMKKATADSIQTSIVKNKTERETTTSMPLAIGKDTSVGNKIVADQKAISKKVSIPNVKKVDDKKMLVTTKAAQLKTESSKPQIVKQQASKQPEVAKAAVKQNDNKKTLIKPAAASKPTEDKKVPKAVMKKQVLKNK